MTEAGSSQEIAVHFFSALLTPGLILGGLSGGNAAWADDVRLLSSAALTEIMQALAPEFERASGHKLTMEFDTATGVKRKIEAGATFNMAIATPAMIADLERQGKLTAGAEIARAGFGVAIRTGAQRPDISSTAAFRQTLLNAQTIIYNKEGQSGIHMAQQFQIHPDAPPPPIP